MTLPDERYRSILQAKKLLADLTDPRNSPRISSIIRARARGALRHFPSDGELEQLANNSPELLDIAPWTIYIRDKGNKL